MARRDANMREGKRREIINYIISRIISSENKLAKYQPPGEMSPYTHAHKPMLAILLELKFAAVRQSSAARSVNHVQQSGMYKQPTTTSGGEGKHMAVMYSTFLLHGRLYYAKGST